MGGTSRVWSSAAQEIYPIFLPLWTHFTPLQVERSKERGSDPLWTRLEDCSAGGVATRPWVAGLPAARAAALNSLKASRPRAFWLRDLLAV